MTLPEGDPVNPRWRPRARADVGFRRVGEDWVLFDPETQKLHLLNLTAALVWSFGTGALDVTTIEEKVRGAFGDDSADPGVRAVLTDFRDARLLEA